MLPTKAKACIRCDEEWKTACDGTVADGSDLCGDEGAICTSQAAEERYYRIWQATLHFRITLEILP